eukprot:TRINITY_DN38160_c0_g1_i1.p1 TRINITY_DN38160_c0_g1~~TRINITY_DN38160_c0_g1_i1.p1  ORF type:complete len:642 (+),score=119.60 TRINITY_DN38160_c0_g1_i1:29-1927(+)
MAWVHWVNYLMGRCCLQLSCVGFGTDGRLKYGLQPRISWRPSPHAWMYVKVKRLPAHGDAAIEVPNHPGPATLLPVPPLADGDIPSPGSRMDWVISLDVGEALPPQRRAGFFRSIGNLAGEGAILSWGRRAAGRHMEAKVTAAMRKRGLRRDFELEAELRLFAGTGCCGHLSRTLLAFRRAVTAPAMPCTVWPGAGNGPENCKLGVTHGCLDAGRAWIRPGCGGVFWNGERDIECSTTTAEAWEYEECDLRKRNGEAPPQPSHVASAAAAARAAASEEAAAAASAASAPAPSRSVLAASAWKHSGPGGRFGASDGGVFEEIHKGSIADLFSSADPLSRPDEPVWQLARDNPAELVVVFKLARLLAMPLSLFRRHLEVTWENEWRYVLLAVPERLQALVTARHVTEEKEEEALSAAAIAAWLPRLLWLVARRARSVARMPVPPAPPRGPRNGPGASAAPGASPQPRRPLAAVAALLGGSAGSLAPRCWRATKHRARRRREDGFCGQRHRSHVVRRLLRRAWEQQGHQAFRLLLLEGAVLWAHLARNALERLPGALPLPLRVVTRRAAIAGTGDGASPGRPELLPAAVAAARGRASFHVRLLSASASAAEQQAYAAAARYFQRLVALPHEAPPT